MSCNIRTIGIATAVTAHPIWAQAHAGTALCVKKSATRKGGTRPTVPGLADIGYYNTSFRLGKTATFVLTPSSLSRLNSPAIPTVPHDFAMVCAVYLEPSGGENHSKQQ